MSAKKGQEVEIGAVKGRPMLTWVGKHALSRVTAFPARLTETYDPMSHLVGDERRDGDYWGEWPQSYHQSGLLFYGDNKEVLANMLVNGFRRKVNLIYIDPPFDSGADYVRKVQLRCKNGTTKLEGENYSLGEQIQYVDIWANDNYLQFMYERLILLKELLADDGSIWLHCDWRKNHHLRLLMDEVFGNERFQAQVTWRSMTSSGYKGKSSLGRSHADLLYYTNGNGLTYNPIYVEMSAEMLTRYKHVDEDGRKFKDSYLGDATPETIEELRRNNLLYVTSTGGYRIKHYLDEAKGTLVDDVWDDIDVENSQSMMQTGYPTQKPEELLDRIIRLTSDPGDIVLDCFLGSGTTAAVAQKLNRRWIGCDINKGAIQTASKRLQTIINERIADMNKPKQNGFGGMDSDGYERDPFQLSFAVYQVNDYDLAIQHNEAVNLACEHIGVERKKTDSFFDGTLGSGSSQELVKIIPFDHPLNIQDLEEVKQELEVRLGEETRSIVLVCLGKELTVDSWLETWNKTRGIAKLDDQNKPVEFVNKIRVIELLTDKKYGEFIVHQPATADVRIERKGSSIHVEIEDFISPTIIKRLGIDTADVPMFKAKISDWRSMVDSVAIDTGYDDQVFNIVLSDVPKRKNDLVKGSYELSAPDSPTNVAIKITDMLGEEVLVTRQV